GCGPRTSCAGPTTGSSGSSARGAKRFRTFTSSTGATSCSTRHRGRSRPDSTKGEPLDFNKLTLKSQEAVAAAQELARRMGNPELYAEHLLLALLDQELPQQLVPDAPALRAQAEAALSVKPSVQGLQQQPGVSAAFSRVLDQAADRSEEHTSELQSPDHLV